MVLFESVFSQRDYPRAAILASCVFLGWPLGDAFLKIAREAQVPYGEVLLVCGMASMATIFIVSALRGKLDNLRPQNWKSLVCLGLLQFFAFLSWILALPHLPLANMYVVSFLTPMAVACLAAIFLKEPIGWSRSLPIILGFVGVVVSVDPSKLSFEGGTIVPYFFLFANMLAASLLMFLLRAVAGKEKSESTAFYSRAIMALGGFFLCLFSGIEPMAPEVFLALCGAGALGGIGWTLLAEAYKYAPAAAVAPFQYLQLLWGAILGYLIWDDVPDAYLVLGAGIIVFSGVALVRQERRITRTMPRVD